jgi:hypothetical protein
MVRTLLLATFAVVISSCASAPPPSPLLPAEASCRRALIAHREDWGGSKTEPVDQVFHVRTIEGEVTVEGALWPGEVTYVYVRPVNQSGPTMVTVATEEGRFRIPEVPQGKYCFATSALGWRNRTGTIIVSKHAPADARIRLEMEPS